MDDFVERLPWRIAALAGLLVGGVSWWRGADLWVSLARVGVAFAVFWLLGWGLRAVMRPAAPPSAGKGTHVDVNTPEITLDDIQSADKSGRTDRDGEGR